MARRKQLQFSIMLLGFFETEIWNRLFAPSEFLLIKETRIFFAFQKSVIFSKIRKISDRSPRRKPMAHTENDPFYPVLFRCFHFRVLSAFFANFFRTFRPRPGSFLPCRLLGFFPHSPGTKKNKSENLRFFPISKGVFLKKRPKIPDFTSF